MVGDRARMGEIFHAQYMIALGQGGRLRRRQAEASASAGALFIHRVASELQPEAHDLSYDIGG
jgi:hypothetical protein